nr:SPOR domain-containing protein [Treponemataceae bacterium]
ILLTIFSSIQLFAEGWFIVLASYKNKENADDIVYTLRQDFIPAKLYQTQVKGQTLYRIILDIAYKTPEEARNVYPELAEYKSVKELKLDNFWICRDEVDVSSENSLPKAILEKKDIYKEITDKISPIEKSPTAIPAIEEIEASEELPAEEVKEEEIPAAEKESSELPAEEIKTESEIPTDEIIEVKKVDDSL